MNFIKELLTMIWLKIPPITLSWQEMNEQPRESSKLWRLATPLLVVIVPLCMLSVLVLWVWKGRHPHHE